MNDQSNKFSFSIPTFDKFLISKFIFMLLISFLIIVFFILVLYILQEHPKEKEKKLHSPTEIEISSDDLINFINDAFQEEYADQVEQAKQQQIHSSHLPKNNMQNIQVTSGQFKKGTVTVTSDVGINTKSSSYFYQPIGHYVREGSRIAFTIDYVVLKESDSIVWGTLQEHVYSSRDPGVIVISAGSNVKGTASMDSGIIDVCIREIINLDAIISLNECALVLDDDLQIGLKGSERNVFISLISENTRKAILNIFHKRNKSDSVPYKVIHKALVQSLEESIDNLSISYSQKSSIVSAFKKRIKDLDDLHALFEDYNITKEQDTLEKVIEHVVQSVVDLFFPSHYKGLFDTNKVYYAHLSENIVPKITMPV